MIRVIRTSQKKSGRCRKQGTQPPRAIMARSGRKKKRRKLCRLPRDEAAQASLAEGNRYCEWPEHFAGVPWSWRRQAGRRQTKLPEMRPRLPEFPASRARAFAERSARWNGSHRRPSRLNHSIPRENQLRWQSDRSSHSTAASMRGPPDSPCQLEP